MFIHSYDNLLLSLCSSLRLMSISLYDVLLFIIMFISSYNIFLYMMFISSYHILLFTWPSSPHMLFFFSLDDHDHLSISICSFHYDDHHIFFSILSSYDVVLFTWCSSLSNLDLIQISHAKPNSMSYQATNVGFKTLYNEWPNKKVYFE